LYLVEATGYCCVEDLMRRDPREGEIVKVTVDSRLSVSEEIVASARGSVDGGAGEVLIRAYVGMSASWRQARVEQREEKRECKAETECSWRRRVIRGRSRL